MSGIVPKEMVAASPEEQRAIVGAPISDDGLEAGRGRLSGLRRAVRCFQTARNLTVTQACYWVARRALGRSYRVPVAPHVAMRDAVKLQAMIEVPASKLVGNKFEFLNRAHDFG